MAFDLQRAVTMRACVVRACVCVSEVCVCVTGGGTQESIFLKT